MNRPLNELSYFPGCSLATTAKENSESLITVCRHMGYDLKELPDWNCCGSSSAHGIKPGLGFNLSCRNLSLAPAGVPLLVACPSCILHLKQAQARLKKDEPARREYERLWGKPYDPDLKILHFFELMDNSGCTPDMTLNGLKFAPYYGCMLARPPELRREKNFNGLMEKLLSCHGANPVTWSYSSSCCGTFLSAAKPEVAQLMVNRIVGNAVDSGVECIVTACAMCHLNIEIRCTLKNPVPVFHFSELLAIAFKTGMKKDWFARHIVDPAPLLKSKGLI